MFRFIKGVVTFERSLLMGGGWGDSRYSRVSFSSLGKFLWYCPDWRANQVLEI